MRTSPSVAVERLLGLLNDVTEGAGGWTARCPTSAHPRGDRKHSLSIGVGDDGRALLYCFAGCSAVEILGAVGLTLSDLFEPRQPRQRTGMRVRNAKRTAASISLSHPPQNGRNPATVDTSAAATPGAKADDAHADDPPTVAAPVATGATGATDATGADAAESGAGCSLEAYAEAKRLPLEVLRGFGLSERRYGGRVEVRIPYLNEAGEETAIRWRTALEKSADGADRFKWNTGAKTSLYGLWRLQQARAHTTSIVLVEGESDAHTCWLHGVPALGLPGAANWRDERDAAHLDAFSTVYVLIEPDQGGEAVQAWLAVSRIRDRARLVTLSDGVKDPSALHLACDADHDRFLAQWQAALDRAIPWREVAHAEMERRRQEAWAECHALAQQPDILSAFAGALAAAGVAGEVRTAKLLFLCLVSRLLKKPVNAVVKGPSSAGKSFLIEQTLRFFPDEAAYVLTAMSEKALAYNDEPLQHRTLVLVEAGGVSSDFAAYLLRSLLSEGRLRYQVTEKRADGTFGVRTIEREGPTNALSSTTRTHLDAELETRLLSLSADDSPQQTLAIFKALVADDTPPPDVGPWHALQRWLADGPAEVSVLAFGEALIGLMQPLAVRLRRDIGQLLALIRAHALLHQASRARDERGRIVATLADYSAVRRLVSDVIAEGIGVTVRPVTRETVTAVAQLTGAPVATTATAAGTSPASATLTPVATVSATPSATASATVAQIARHLKLDKSTVSRRVRVALDAGYLVNDETRKGRAAQLRLGEPLPEDVEILPTAEQITEALAEAMSDGNRCTVAPVLPGQKRETHVDSPHTPHPPEPPERGSVEWKF